MNDPGQAVLLIIALTGTGVISYGVIALVQVVVKRLGGSSGRVPDALHEELAEMRARLDDGEQARERIAELEERLDFAERMLAQQREQGSLPGGRDKP